MRNGILYVRAPISRKHDHLQILDNAKHMYFSTQPVEIPESGEISFELNIWARSTGTAPNDLYDGYVSLNRNGQEVLRERGVPVKFNRFTVALGIMTEKDLTPQGSVSAPGQTVIAEWSPMTITVKE